MSRESAPAARPSALLGRLRAPMRAALARPLVRRAGLYLALVLALLLADAICARASMPIAITHDDGGLTIRAGSVTRHLASHASLLAVTIPPRDPVVHDYQLDGSDFTNNYTLDSAYLHTIAGSPYYRFIAWMRGLDDLSRWRDLCVAADSTDATPARCATAPPIAAGQSLAVPDGARQRVTASLQQPETPVTLELDLSDGSSVSLFIGPNDHRVIITPFDASGLEGTALSAFYPNDPGDIWPLAAQTLDLIVRVLLWSLALLGAVWGIEAAVGQVWRRRTSPPNPLSYKERGNSGARLRGLRGRKPLGADPSVGPFLAGRSSAIARAGWARLTAAIHPIGLALIGAAFGFMIWIALVQYHAQPHIYDASAYLFQAKIYASGRLYAPAPATPGQFPGPFTAVIGDRWFSQYEPGTSATLALGVALGVPWLVEPLLGALALVGMGLTLRRLYNRRVATLAVILGAISPFFLWLSASYLSHTVALFYLIWGLWALTRFAQGGSAWTLPLAAALWALALLTRDSATLFIAASVAGLAWIAWRERWPVVQRQVWSRPRTWAAPLVWTAVAISGYLTVYYDYNTILTGNPSLTPRALMYPFDHWGFGQGVGFYGQHTLAAGFITVQALLTSLAITLYGWPLYLTLALLPLPFLARRARPADAFLLGSALLLTFAFLGFYYHGVYLGPRYLLEALPFFLGLTARGIITLFEVGEHARVSASRGASDLTPGPSHVREPYTRTGASLDARPTRRGEWNAPPLATPALLLALLACAALSYFPRQIALYTNFTGLGASVHIQTAILSHPPVHHAIVITDDRQFYGYTLFGLNDPDLRGDVLYTYAPSASDQAALRRAYPGRALYLLTFDAHGQLRYQPLYG